MSTNTGARGISLIPAMFLATCTAVTALVAIWLQLSSYIGAH